MCPYDCNLENNKMSQIEEIQNVEETEDELYEHHRFVIDKGQEKYRIDKYLTERITPHPFSNHLLCYQNYYSQEHSPLLKLKLQRQ